MAEDPLHDIIESMRARLKTELETQLKVAAERHQQDLVEQRARVEAEAEERFASRLQAVRAEAEQQASAAAVSEPRAGALLQSLRDIDAAASISDVLAAIVRAASSGASRPAIFLANGTQLDEWSAGGSTAARSIDTNAPDAGILAEALRGRRGVREDGSECAFPLVLDGTAVGVLHAEAPADTVEAVARHGAARLGYLTALRTAQARQWLADSTAAASSTPASSHQEDTTTSARRYARLVVSEIKLYNESAVQEGRSRRDLLARLGPEIDRARRLYEERVPAVVPGRSGYFQQELVQTLAGGDPSLLG